MEDAQATSLAMNSVASLYEMCEIRLAYRDTRMYQAQCHGKKTVFLQFLHNHDVA